MTRIRTVRRGVRRWLVGVAVAAVAVSTLSAMPAVAATGIVSGTLTMAVDGGPSVPVEGGTVTFYATHGTGDVTATVTTGADGTYSAAVPIGGYGVLFSSPGLPLHTASWVWLDSSIHELDSPILTVTSSGVSGVDAELPLASTLSGAITYNDGVDPSDHYGAIWAFFLNLDTFTFERTIGFAKADESGNYVLGGLLPGTYLLRYGDWRNPPVLETRYYDNVDALFGASPFVVEAGVDVTGQDAALDEGGLVVSRLGGPNRFATAAAISFAGHPSTADTVFVANGLNYPDALSAGPVAGLAGAPLLLVTPTTLPPETKAEIERLAPTNIVVMGGTGSVSNAIFAQLEGLAQYVDRLGGADRYATSRMVADTFWDCCQWTGYIANGSNFPDALAAGPAAANESAPVLLVNGAATSVDSATAALLDDLGIGRLVIAGGTGSVSGALEQGLSDLSSSFEAYRKGGSDRYETASLLVNGSFRLADVVFLASGANFPDALSGGALAGYFSAPVFLAQQNCVPGGVLDEITRLKPARVVLLGGTGILGPGVEQLTRC